jgi:rhodanese-related sulfurtransferase/vacuolar-type H+-ATPase subunit H
MSSNNLGGIIPQQPPIEAQSDAHVLKSRLEWGEPAFTILDVRDRETYNDGHIMGALPYPVDDLVDRASSTIDKSRDIYVYGASEEQTAQAAQSLRSAGFVHVSELKGGLGGWKAIGGPTEGRIESRTPAGADDYNVVDRVKDHLENQPKSGTSIKKDIGDVKNSVGEAASEAKNRVSEAASEAKDRVGEAASQVKENLEKAGDNLKEGIKDSNQNQQ